MRVLVLLYVLFAAPNKTKGSAFSLFSEVVSVVSMTKLKRTAPISPRQHAYNGSRTVLKETAEMSEAQMFSET